MEEEPRNATMDETTDETLAARVQRGDETALSALMTRYEPKLMRYGRRFLGHDAEDLLVQAVQDIFILMYQNSESFDVGQRFSPWIYRIAHNAFVDVLRQRTRQPVYGFNFDTLLSHPVHEDVYAKEKENAELRVLLEKGLATLPAAQREIISLYYFDDLSYKEISDVLHIPISTVGVRLGRARAALKNAMPEDFSLLLP